MRESTPEDEDALLTLEESDPEKSSELPFSHAATRIFMSDMSSVTIYAARGFDTISVC